MANNNKIHKAYFLRFIILAIATIIIRLHGEKLLPKNWWVGSKITQLKGKCGKTLFTAVELFSWTCYSISHSWER